MCNCNIYPAVFFSDVDLDVAEVEGEGEPEEEGEGDVEEEEEDDGTDLVVLDPSHVSFLR